MAQVKLPIILFLFCPNLFSTCRSLQKVARHPHFWRGDLGCRKIKIHHWTSSKNFYCWKIARFSLHGQARFRKTQNGTQKCKIKQPMGRYRKHWRLYWKNLLDHFGIFWITHDWYQQNRRIQDFYLSWYNLGIIAAITLDKTLQENQMQSWNSDWGQNSVSLFQIVSVISLKKSLNKSKEPTKVYIESNMHFPLFFGIKN